MYERHKEAAEAYAREALGWADAKAIDSKHDRLVPDGVLVLMEVVMKRTEHELLSRMPSEQTRWAMLLHEHTAQVAEDSLEEEDFINGTAR